MVFFAIYGGLTGGAIASAAGALATLNAYDKSFHWLLRLLAAVASAIGGAVNIPFTLPREFFD